MFYTKVSGSTLFGLCLLICSACAPNKNQFEARHQIGVISAFAEMVAADVKQLALSSPLTPAQAEELSREVAEIAEEYNVEIIRESDLIITDLFPEDVVDGKEVFVIAKPNALYAYRTLKSDLSKLGPNDQTGRQMIARRFGRLLSYSPKKINQLLSQQTSFRTMTDFGLVGSNVFLYYKDLEAAEQFFTDIIGLTVLSRFDNAVILRISTSSTITLVDASKGMHSANEPKTVAIALLTNQLKDWYDHLLQKNVNIKYPYKSNEGSAHDGFVAIDPEGYLLEFETFKQHPENERFMPILELNREYKSNIPQQELSFHGSIVWTYHKDLLAMGDFYQNVMGLELVADQGWTKIYQVSKSGFIGLVDERRGMHSFTEEKGVTLSFVLEDLDGWHAYASSYNPFELRSDEISIGPDERYRAFVAYGPEGYFLEFDKFYQHPANASLIHFFTEE